MGNSKSAAFVEAELDPVDDPLAVIGPEFVVAGSDQSRLMFLKWKTPGGK